MNAPLHPAESRDGSFFSSEALLSAIVESSDDAIISKNLEGIVTSWNPGAERIFGYLAGEMVGESITKIIPEDRRDEETQILERMRKGERVEHFDTRRVRKDGVIVEVSLTISPVRDAGGLIVGASKIARDITQRKLAEESLRRQGAQLKIVSELAAAFTAELDLERLIQAVTDAGRELSGAAFGAFFYTATSKEGEAFLLYTLSGAPRQAFEKFGVPRNTPIFHPTFSGQGVVRIGDVQKDPRYGQLPPHHGMPPGHLPVRSYLAVPVVDKARKVIGGLFFGHPEPDVFTEQAEELLVAIAAQAAVAIENAQLYEAQRKSAEDLRLAGLEAERQSRMKDEFLATLSHELRTPLQSIIGWLQILRSDDSSADDLQQGLEVIDRNAQNQARIIEDLLDMSRILSGKVRLDVQRVGLASVIESALETVRPAAEAKEIELQAILDPLAKPISGDPNRLQQIFWNLLSNAIKFTPKGGKVQVVLERVNSHLEVNIADSGAGISPEFLSHVFERFRQADASITRAQGGLGLGLAIVKHLVELHGGTVRVKSPGIGKGSTFAVFLPLASIYPEPEENRRHPAAAASESGRRQTPRLDAVAALIVDDEEDSRQLVARLLKRAGAQVVEAGSVTEALALLPTRKFDVIISDIGMPVQDGYCFIRAIRALPVSQGGAIPAIALTAYARTEDRIRAISAGFQVHLSKPADGLELLTMVESLVRKIS